MAITSKQKIEARRKQENEYRIMREKLLEIATASDTSNADRIAAINTIYMLDSNTLPAPHLYYIKD